MKDGLNAFEMYQLASGSPIIQHGSVAVIIPCYKVRNHIAAVISGIGQEVSVIYCIDDACPDKSGQMIEQEIDDDRVRVLYHRANEGVGGAMLTGYRQALADGHDILVKIDGDGQMDPALIPQFILPIVDGTADYTKGNRFFYIENTKGMPAGRLIGNGALSFMTKLSSGYWNIFDPTNGYTAMHKAVAEILVSRDIDKRYFFETDMLLHLYLIRAVVRDIPMAAVYRNEKSNLNAFRVALPFLIKNLKNSAKRFFIHYLIRDFSLATIEAIVAIVLLTFGTIAGASFWLESYYGGVEATAGEVMIAALPILSGTQLLLSALNFDMRNVPSIPFHKYYRRLSA
ncbi:glycosyltransferase family 2 protein [Sphingomonas sp. LY29]|uniref:glycosyltransferase family 2 protein n=1 Tax=Sphingomonas sp. LY29 TaxID=3095341 RepID=UPI002D79ECD5|nr:glycosyltransferase family 2 protein [Sphingomonas sp. LY29]WRP26356.1 glycosyltransferase family 2 protein [Sphingomonas sp. LY29]